MFHRIRDAIRRRSEFRTAYRLGRALAAHDINAGRSGAQDSDLSDRAYHGTLADAHLLMGYRARTNEEHVQPAAPARA